MAERDIQDDVVNYGPYEAEARELCTMLQIKLRMEQLRREIRALAAYQDENNIRIRDIHPHMTPKIDELLKLEKIFEPEREQNNEPHDGGPGEAFYGFMPMLFGGLEGPLSFEPPTRKTLDFYPLKEPMVPSDYRAIMALRKGRSIYDFGPQV